MDEKTLEDNPDKGSENIYYKGKAHIEYDRDKNDLTGHYYENYQEHDCHETDGPSPIKKIAPLKDLLRN
jgi:hypothetical protein